MGTASTDLDVSQALVLAAEDCPPEDFGRLHVFHSHEERIIQALCAHGPILVKGGRGSGKSALMIEADRRMGLPGSGVLSVYLSLRSVPLLRSVGVEYEKLFCMLLSEQITRRLGSSARGFPIVNDVLELQRNLQGLVEQLGQRLVLLFDDVAHIGREASLEEFFGIFRTISSNRISCKATIYPGVTRFGVRFDVYNDATVLDLARDERAVGYASFFEKVIAARFQSLYERLGAYRGLGRADVSAFLGRSVVGNMRGFVYACTRLEANSQSGLPALEQTLKELSSDYYWPLLEELEPKLGIYQPLVEGARQLAEQMFRHAAAQKSVPSVIVHREIVQRLSKTFEILEYAGFISKREASRAMRSGGRGPRFALNLANLIEFVNPSRLTRELFKDWSAMSVDQPTDLHVNSGVISVEQPQPLAEGELSVFALPIERLQKSNTYPYGLTETKIADLRRAGFETIGHLASATDADLYKVPGVAEKWSQRIRSAVGQAVWM
jgi:hypothetical protein